MIHLPPPHFLAAALLLQFGIVSAAVAQEPEGDTGSPKQSQSVDAPSPEPTAKATSEAPSEDPAPATAPAPSEIEARLAKTNSTFAEVLPERPYKAMNRFFTMLVKGNIDAAYEIFVDGSPIAKKPEDILTLKEKTRQAIELFGALRGYEIVNYDQLGTSLIRITCVSLGDLYPLRWHLYFYRATGDWTLIDIRVDDKLSSLFEDGDATGPVVPTPRPKP